MPAPDRSQHGPVGRFGAPVGPGAERPPHVLLAAVTGFLQAALLLLAATAYFTYSGTGALFTALGAAFLILAVGCALGGVRALQGKDRTVLAVSGGAAAGIALVLIAVSVAGGTGFDAFSALLVLLGTAIAVLLLQPPSREWFAARRNG